MKLNNCVTVNTDASFCKDTKAAGYAFYIVTDNFKVTSGGNFKTNPKTPLEAEIMCIGNALYTLLQAEIPPVKLIVINSDCQHAFARIGKKSTDAAGRKVAFILSKLRQKLAYRNILPEFEFRYVKAHNGTPDKRSYVNDWCDKEAKQWMRKQRNIIKNENRIKP